MSYMNKVWMAATVAVVQGHADQGSQWKAGLRSAHRVKKRLASDLRPLVGSDLTVDGVPGDERRRPAPDADESLRQVMYLNCWGQG